MRSLSRTWPPVTDRYARMRKRAATVPNAEQLRAEFEQAWAQVVSSGPQTHRLVVLPTGSMRRPTRADRRCKRMRAQVGRIRSAAERRANRLILRSWFNQGAYSAAEVRRSFGLPAADQFIDACLPVERTTFPGGETASERMGRLLRWAGFGKAAGPVEVTYIGPAFPSLDPAGLGVAPIDIDDPAQVDAAIDAANQHIEATTPLIVSKHTFLGQRATQVEEGTPPTPWIDPNGATS